jgi:hypothetical protein
MQHEYPPEVLSNEIHAQGMATFQLATYFLLKGELKSKEPQDSPTHLQHRLKFRTSCNGFVRLSSSGIVLSRRLYILCKNVHWRNWKKYSSKESKENKDSEETD